MDIKIRELIIRGLIKEVQGRKPGQGERWEDNYRIIEKVGDLVGKNTRGIGRSKAIERWLNKMAEKPNEEENRYIIDLERARRIRNSAIHEGGRSEELQEITERIIKAISEGLQREVEMHKDSILKTVSFYMTRNVKVAEPGIQLKEIVGWMLKYDISYIPGHWGEGTRWSWIDIATLACYIRKKKEEGSRGIEDIESMDAKDMIAQRGESTGQGVKHAKVVEPTAPVELVYEELKNGNPGVLVSTKSEEQTLGDGRELLGIVTAYDLLKLRRG